MQDVWKLPNIPDLWNFLPFGHTCVVEVSRCRLYLIPVDPQVQDGTDDAKVEIFLFTKLVLF